MTLRAAGSTVMLPSPSEARGGRRDRLPEPRFPHQSLGGQPVASSAQQQREDRAEHQGRQQERGIEDRDRGNPQEQRGDEHGLVPRQVPGGRNRPRGEDLRRAAKVRGGLQQHAHLPGLGREREGRLQERLEPCEVRREGTGAIRDAELPEPPAHQRLQVLAADVELAHGGQRRQARGPPLHLRTPADTPQRFRECLVPRLQDSRRSPATPRPVLPAYAREPFFQLSVTDKRCLHPLHPPLEDAAHVGGRGLRRAGRGVLRGRTRAQGHEDGPTIPASRALEDMASGQGAAPVPCSAASSPSGERA